MNSLGLVCLMTALNFSYPVQLERVIDGDTAVFWVERGDTFKVFEDFDQLWRRRETIRFLGVDTPERKAGAEATAFAEHWILSHHVLTVKTNYKRDGFGRLLGRICSGDECLDEALIKAGLGQEYCP